MPRKVNLNTPLAPVKCVKCFKSAEWWIRVANGFKCPHCGAICPTNDFFGIRERNQRLIERHLKTTPRVPFSRPNYSIKSLDV